MNDDPEVALRAYLHRTDPARELPNLTDRERAELASRSRRARVRTPSRLPLRLRWVVAATAAVIAVATGVSLVGAPAPKSADLAQPGAAVSGSALQSCVPVSAAEIAAADLAIEGTVTSIEDGIVTLSVSATYVGETTSVATIPQGDSMQADRGSIVFELGAPYLLTASGGQLGACGLSGPLTPALKTLFQEAAR